MAKKTGFSFLDDPEEKGKKEEASSVSLLGKCGQHARQSIFV